MGVQDVLNKRRGIVTTQAACSEQHHFPPTWMVEARFETLETILAFAQKSCHKVFLHTQV